jgi:hypothetical protein
VAGFVAFLLVAAGFAVILAGFAWLASRIRRRGLGGALMGPLDEVYNPATHRLRFEIQTHEQRMVPIPPADDQRRRDADDLA